MDFTEVYVHAPMEVCEERIRRAFTKRHRGDQGIHRHWRAPYEAPEDPEVTVHTAQESLNESVAHIVEFLPT